MGNYPKQINDINDTIEQYVFVSYVLEEFQKYPPKDKEDLMIQKCFQILELELLIRMTQQ